MPLDSSDYGLPARFWNKVDKTDTCWIWTGCRDSKAGYGRFGLHGKVHQAHRVVLEAALGRSLTADEYACHSCDVPWCVNPAHLWVGTNAENVRDSAEKGRWRAPVAQPDFSQIAEQLRTIQQALAYHQVTEVDGACSLTDPIASDDGASPKGQKMRLRCNGPYKHYSQFRLVITRDGVRSFRDFATVEEAEQYKVSVRREMALQNGTTILEALSRYEERLAKSCKAAGVRTVIDNVKVFFADELDTCIKALSSADLIRLRKRLEASDYSVCTMASVAGMTRTFLRWCRRERHLKLDWEDALTGVGKRKRGSKPQLRKAEAATWLRKALILIETGDTAALAAALLLLTGLRAGEVTERVGRDVDDGGRLLWVEDAKNDASNRPVTVPELLAPALHKLATKVGRQGRLFTGGIFDRKKSRVDWVSRKIAEICRVTGLHRVTPHGLRGSFASIALSVNVAPDQVAGALAHQSFSGMTKTHYVDPGVLADTEQRRVLAAVTDQSEKVTGPDSRDAQP